MVDINKADIKLMASQRLDDTDQGGGQMTGTEVVDGAVNNLFPDISRLDRTYGRVSMRKAFLSVRTLNRAVYYGSHEVMTQQAADPLVGVSFFTTKDWFDTRNAARNRIEAYLVKGTLWNAALFGDVYKGSKALKFQHSSSEAPPEIGDVLVLFSTVDLNGTVIPEREQFVRVVSVTTDANHQFTDNGGAVYTKAVTDIEIGSALLYDFKGEGVIKTSDYTTAKTKIYDTVVADSSKYYGVSTLAEPIDKDTFQLRVTDVNTPLVPSAQSQTPITDAGAGTVTSPVIFGSQPSTVTGTMYLADTAPFKRFVGTAVKPGSFSAPGASLTDNGKGDLVQDPVGVVGSIEYNTGTLNFNVNPGVSSSSYSFDAAVAPEQVATAGSIAIDINNRGFVYTFRCVPLPQPITLRVDFLSGGKWYSMWDKGGGEIKGTDSSIGSGAINYSTGSLSVTLGAMPDVGSSILFFWSGAVKYRDMPAQDVPFVYDFTLQDTGIALGTFNMSWTQSSIPHVITDKDSDGKLYYDTNTLCGSINYATGEVKIDTLPITPPYGTNFDISYDKGAPIVETFKPTDLNYTNGNNKGFSIDLSNTGAIIPHTLSVEWISKLVDSTSEYTDDNNVEKTGKLTRKTEKWISTYATTSFADKRTYKYKDNGAGTFKDEDPTHAGNPDAFAAIIDYDPNGNIKFCPNFDETGTFETDTQVDITDSWVKNGDPQKAFSTSSESETFNDDVAYEYDFNDAESKVTVSYYTDAGTDSVNYTTGLDKKFRFEADDFLFMEANSGIFKIGGKWLVDQEGKVYGNINSSDGSAEEFGTINYETKEVILTSLDSVCSSEGSQIVMSLTSGLVSAGIDNLSAIFFRTPGAPITPGSFSLQCVVSDGTQINATSDFSGKIEAVGIYGQIDFQTGIVTLTFGETIVDDGSYTHEGWYSPANVSNGNVWRPWYVQASSIRFNCVVESYLPLDADLLGLDPVRLPLDGKVPIFRDGGILLIHNTKQEQLPNPVTAGSTYNLSRGDLSLIELYDSEGTYVPETDIYTYDLAAGTVTMNDPLDVSAYVQPLVALNRIEDMVLASDVQITGYINVISPITHDYTAGDTLVSSVLPSGDLQARIYNEFTQDSWKDEWLDNLSNGTNHTLAKYDLVNYPIALNNESAVQERFACIFTAADTFELVGEHLGVIIEAQSTSLDCAPINPATGQPYFTMDKNGWGSGWSAGDVFRFNSAGANYPLWFIRTTLQGPATENSDFYTVQLRGDSS